MRPRSKLSIMASEEEIENAIEEKYIFHNNESIYLKSAIDILSNVMRL